MDEREKAEEQVEDLEPTGEESEDVKGGAGNGTFTLTFNGQTTSPRGGGDELKRGGWDGNHNQTLIAI